MTTMTADDLADSINRGKKWKVIGCIGHDCEECQTRIAKDASHRSTAQEVDMKMVIDRAVVEQALEALLTPSGAQACSTCQNGPENEYCCRMEMWSAVAALRAALAQPVPHGCHVDLHPGMKPDGCVLDDGRPENCIYAKRLLREGKDKTACEYWQPIEVTR